jgi:hypothetical protein
MPIVCIEGPSAVGKSSTSRYLAEQHGAIHIPEVNLLFKRPSDESAYWYCERQVERFQMARSHPEDCLVILDGDPFQPIWYNPLFPSVSNLSYQQVLDFYRSQLERNQLDWPDRYLILSAPVAELRKRKELDLRFQRRKFEAHLALVDFLPKYFGQFSPELVLFKAAETLETNANALLEAKLSKASQRDSVEIFDRIAAWMKLNS